MLRVYTSRCFTFMVKLFSFRNWPIEEFVGMSMSQDYRSVGVKHTVAVLVCITCPEPTSLCFSNSVPEIYNRSTHSTPASSCGHVIASMSAADQSFSIEVRVLPEG